MASLKNEISELKEVHDRAARSNRALLEPQYTFHQKTGLPLGFEAVCTYKSFETYGEGNSKKTAQRDAASKMLLKLNYLPLPKTPLVETDINRVMSPACIPKPAARAEHLLKSEESSEQSKVTEELARVFLSKYSSEGCVKAASHHYPPSPDSLAICFNDINFGMKLPNAPKSESLTRHKKMHPIECFEKVMEEMQMKFCCVQAEVDPKKVGKEHVILLKINFHCLTVGAKGDTLGKAVESACQQGIDSFLLYMK